MDDFVEELAKAMAAEFNPMLSAEHSEWVKAAAGVANKMGVTCEPGSPSTATRFYVEGIE